MSAPGARRPGTPGATVSLQESYARCKELNRRHGTTYYLAAQVLPRVKRHHVHALYGFCRHADDIVDDLGPAPTDVRAKALHDFGDRFFEDLDRGRSDDPVLKAVVHTVQAFGLDPAFFHRFLHSMAMDLTVSSYESWEDLLVYMDGSAAVIGEMMLPILEPEDLDAARPGAMDLGNAFQLTNFLRDVGEDLDRGRVYLPQEDLRRYRCRSPRTARDAGVDRGDPVPDRPLPGPLPVRRRRHPVVAPGVGGGHPLGPDPLLGDPRPHRGRRLRRVQPPGTGPHGPQAGRGRIPVRRPRRGPGHGPRPLAVRGSRPWTASST